MTSATSPLACASWHPIHDVIIDICRHLAIIHAMEARRSFTLRFEHPETHDLLSLVSDRLGVSMNQLAEQMITTELEVVSAGLQADLMHTLGMLGSYRSDAEAEAEAFARAEVAFADPIRARMVGGGEDPFGVASAYESGARG